MICSRTAWRMDAGMTMMDGGTGRLVIWAKREGVDSVIAGWVEFGWDDIAMDRRSESRVAKLGNVLIVGSEGKKKNALNSSGSMLSTPFKSAWDPEVESKE